MHTVGTCTARNDFRRKKRTLQQHVTGLILYTECIPPMTPAIASGFS